MSTDTEPQFEQITPDALFTIDQAIDKVVGRRPLRERMRVRRTLREYREELILHGVESFTLANAAVEGIPLASSPFIDLWKWIMENNKIQAFVQFLVETVLPAIIAAIEKIADIFNAMG